MLGLCRCHWLSDVLVAVMSAAVDVQRLSGRLLVLLVVVVSLLCGERWAAVEATSRLRRTVTPSAPAAAVYNGKYLRHTVALQPCRLLHCV